MKFELPSGTAVELIQDIPGSPTVRVKNIRTGQEYAILRSLVPAKKPSVRKKPRQLSVDEMATAPAEGLASAPASDVRVE